MKFDFSANLLACSGLLLLFATCTGNSKTSDPEQLQRMVELRKRLKNEIGDRYDLAVQPGSKNQLERGMELYVQVCAPCHGANGRGDGHTAQGLIGNPTDLTDPEQATFYSEQARLYIIKKGIDGTPMMGWQNVLTDEDVFSVYVYVRSLIDQQN